MRSLRLATPAAIFVLTLSTLYGPAAAPVEALTDLLQTGIGAGTAWVLVPLLKKYVPRSR